MPVRSLPETPGDSVSVSLILHRAGLITVKVISIFQRMLPVELLIREIHWKYVPPLLYSVVQLTVSHFMIRFIRIKVLPSNFQILFLHVPMKENVINSFPTQ